MTSAPAPAAEAAASNPPTAFNELLPAFASAPHWWSARKREAFAEFEALPYPTRKDERWRFSSLSRLGVEGFDFTTTASASEAASALAIAPSAASRAGRIVYADHTLAAFDPLPAELTARGVVFAPLHLALERHTDLLERHFASHPTRLGSEKFAALHTAFTRAGALIVVPPGVSIDLPILTAHIAVRPGAALFPHTIVVAGANSRVRLIEQFATADGSTAHFAAGAAQVFAGDGAHVGYKVFQNWSEQALAFHLVSLTAGRDAFVKQVAVNLGGRQYRSETQAVLEGSGSRVETYALSVTEGEQEIDQRTLQIHNAPRTASDLLFKNALFDTSRTIFSGLIKVAPDAQRTDAYQSNRNLLLSPSAEANSLPGLEIGANDVRCTHGSTTGRISPEELFYLRARGIPTHLARRLLVLGFFDEVLARIEDETVRADLNHFLQARFLSHS